MKTYRTYILCLLLGFGVIMPVLTTSCSSPTTRNTTVATLLTVGHTAEAAVSLSATLYADHKITEAQAYAVFDFYNTRWQPAFRVARTAARFDSNAIAPLELINLSNELTAMVAALRK